MSQFKKKLHQIQAFAFDVDGVFSRTQFILSPEGTLMRTMNAKDGYAVQYAHKNGYPVAIISGGRDEAVRKRFENLGLTDIYLRSMHKCDDFQDFLYKYGLKAEHVLYMGDDLPDIDVMKAAGIAACPADAVPEIKAVADYISDKNGGDGCVRDILEQVLKTQQKWATNPQDEYVQ